MKRYARTVKISVSRPENEPLKIPLTLKKSVIENKSTPPTGIIFNSDSQTSLQIPIDATVLLAQTSSQIAAVSYLGA